VEDLGAELSGEVPVGCIGSVLGRAVSSGPLWVHLSGRAVAVKVIDKVLV
jgi:hypothetical protein